MISYWAKVFDTHNIKFTQNTLEEFRNISSFENNSNQMYATPIAQYNMSKILYGGDRTTYSYKNRKIAFFKSEDKFSTIYSLKEYNNEEQLDCLVIIIEKNSNRAIINNISAYENCKDSSNKIFSGSELLEIAISFIKSLKPRYNLNKIRLTDNSHKPCITGKKLVLSRMYILLHGDTWYGKHGFTPYTKKIGVNLLEEYYINTQINKRIKVKNASNLKKYFIDFYKSQVKGPNYIHSEHINKYIKMIESNQEQNLGEFLQLFLKDYTKNCAIFSSFCDKLFNDIGYRDFYSVEFEMSI